jgi:hypothetical protein
LKTIELLPADTDGDGEPDMGTDTLKATDFLEPGVILDDCSPFDIPGNVKYFAFKDTDLPGGSSSLTIDMLTGADTSLIFTCSDKAALAEVYVVALDSAGNFGVCTTTVEFTSPETGDPCASTGGLMGVEGMILTEAAVPVGNVAVEVMGQDSSMKMTHTDGMYQVGNLLMGAQYNIVPRMDKDPLNGVSTLDLMLISKHILRVQPLSSPYKIIAADVNRSGNVSTVDMVQLRKLILGVRKRLPNNTSWRFIDYWHEFPQPDNPFYEPFPEKLHIDKLVQDIPDANFIAIKVGDVNGSARANALASAEERSVPATFYLQAPEMKLRAGSEYVVEITADQLPDIRGYQATLAIDPNYADFVDLHYAMLQAENFGVFADQGLITMSWHTDSPFEITNPGSEGQASKPLFGIVLRARSEALLSEVLSLNSRITRAEAYNEQDAKMDMGLLFREKQQNALPFELYQNEPNPFVNATVIGFQMPETGEATLRIQDIRGRSLKVINGIFEKGYNEIRLEGEDLPPVGVLFYTLETKDHEATKRMIRVQ